MTLKQIEATALTDIANALAAQEATILSELTAFNGVAATDIENLIATKLPPIIAAIVKAAFAADAGAVTAALAGGEKQALDYIIGLLKAEAATLAA